MIQTGLGTKQCAMQKGLGAGRRGAHAYNPSYLGGRDQEDRSLKPAG
jgi:hypothetical protein